MNTKVETTSFYSGEKLGFHRKKREKKPKAKIHWTVGLVITYVFLVFMLVIYLAPLLWTFMVSFKTNAEIFTSPFTPPRILQLGNYIVAWTAGHLGSATLNSFAVSVITLALSMFLGATISFALGIMRWKGQTAVLTYFMMGMMIPVHCVLIPLFTRFAHMGLSNTLTGIIIPYLTFSLPTVIFIMTGFFKSLPHELIESACIDGANIYQIFWKIAVPLARTGFFVTGMMTFIDNWNELLLAMVFISDDEKKTLPVALSKFVGPYNTNYSQMFAAIVLAIIPTIVVYCCFSNQIVDGLTAGAVKG